jgi:hypothetical protein
MEVFTEVLLSVFTASLLMAFGYKRSRKKYPPHIIQLPMETRTLALCVNRHGSLADPKDV